MKVQKKKEWKHGKERGNKKRTLALITGVLACFVLVFTVHSLILPALSMETKTYCKNEEHTHTLACYSNPEADAETAADWEKTLPALTGDVHKDMAEIALSQVGYRESEKNYQVEGEDLKKGYTRYGAWADDPYGDWDQYLIGFAAYYARADLMLKESVDALSVNLKGDGRYVYPTSKGIAPGDLAFLRKDGKSTVGILTSVDPDGTYSVVVGDVENRVQKITVAKTDCSLEGIGLLEKPVVKKNRVDSLLKTNGAGADIQRKVSGKNTFRLALPKAGPVDLTPMVSKVLVERKVNGRWEPIWDNQTIYRTDEIRVGIHYTIPGGTLGSGKNTVVYRIPKGIEPVKVENGTVYNNENQAVGTYRIDTGGVIIITFFDEFAQSNEKGHAIEGAVSFKGHTEGISGSGKEKLTLGFTEDIKLNVQIEDEDLRKGNISLEKKAVKSTQNPHKILYTLVISSTEGTSGPVILNDVLKGAVYDGAVSVKDQTGRTWRPTPAPTRGSRNYTVTLPKMAPHTTYTVAYPVWVDEDTVFQHGNDFTAKNTATVSSKDSKQNPIDAMDTTYTYYDALKKTPSYNSQRDEVKWTIVINQDKLDISGWELQDKLSGAKPIGSVIMKDSHGNSRVITLPYTFPAGSRDTYTVTYLTKPLHNSLGEDRITNQATLHRRGETIAWAISSAVIGNNTPIKKEASGKSRLENGAVVTPWKITVYGLEKFEGATVVRDTLPYHEEKRQYFTGKQLKEARSRIEQVMRENQITVSEWKICLYTNPMKIMDWSGIRDQDQYLGFQYRIETKKPADTSVSYLVESSAVPKNGSMTLYNYADINARAIVIAETKYEPNILLLTKSDPSEPGVAVTKHDYNHLYQGEVQWHVELKVPAEQRNQTVTITEELPQGTDLQSFMILAGDLKDATGSLVGKNQAETSLRWNVGGKAAEVKITKTGNRITVSIPKELHAYCDGKYRLYVTVKMNDSVRWSGNENSGLRQARITNCVTAETASHSVLAEQTQVIEKNRLEHVVSKTGTQGERNLVTYRVPINPEGWDLIEGSDVIYLTDLMEHTDNKRVHAYLVPGSVTYTTRDGTVVKPKYIYTEKQDDGWEGRNTYAVKVELPDEMPLTLTYQYGFKGNGSSERFPVKNKAVLEGISDQNAEENHSLELVLQDSGAIANIKGIMIYKVDAKDQGRFLEGAEFRLERYDVGKKAFVPVLGKNGREVFVSDHKGRINLTDETVNNIAYNTAYRLTETKAPAGYVLNPLPYEFYLDDPDLGAHPRAIPQGFRGTRLYDGSLVYYTNEAGETELEIIKNWRNEDGSTLTEPGVAEVKIRLYREDASGKSQLLGIYSVTKREGWKKTITGLPQAPVDANGKPGTPYVYRVEEETVAGFRADYDHKNIHMGKIKVTNTKVSGYTLPNTGGTGIFPFLFGGILLMIGALLGLRFAAKKTSP